MHTLGMGLTRVSGFYQGSQIASPLDNGCGESSAKRMLEISH